MNEKEELIKLISNIEREDVINYLLVITKDVVEEISKDESR